MSPCTGPQLISYSTATLNIDSSKMSKAELLEVLQHLYELR